MPPALHRLVSQRVGGARDRLMKERMGPRGVFPHLLRLESSARFTVEFFRSYGQLTSRASWATLSTPSSLVVDPKELNNEAVFQKDSSRPLVYECLYAWRKKVVVVKQ